MILDDPELGQNANPIVVLGYPLYSRRIERFALCIEGGGPVPKSARLRLPSGRSLSNSHVGQDSDHNCETTLRAETTTSEG